MPREVPRQAIILLSLEHVSCEILTDLIACTEDGKLTHRRVFFAPQGKNSKRDLSLARG